VRFATFFVAIAFLPASVPARGTPAMNANPRSPAIDLYVLSENLRRISASLEKNPSPKELAVLRDSLPAQWNVSTSASDYAISTEFLRKKLADGSTEDAEAWVKQLANELDSYSGVRRQNNAHARVELDDILAIPEFAGVHPPTAWDLFRQRLARWIGRFFEWLFGGLMRYPIGGQIVFWVIVVGCVGFIALWVFRFMMNRDRWQSLPPGHVATPSRTWQEWIRTAREAASRNDYREAVHCAYWAGITRLEDMGALPKDPARTPREYLRLLSEPAAPELSPRAAYREPLSALTARFERIWYANRGANSDDFRDALQQLEAMGCQLE
jgi:Domain of unknown function (DUF4129)